MIWQRVRMAVVACIVAASASLPPMSSYERKIVHDIVAERGFRSESEGEGRDRHTVISRG